MSSATNSSPYYSNETYYKEAADTFANSQARQAAAFTRELLRDYWLTSQLEITAKKAAALSPAAVKERADNLLRLTKTRALKRLHSAA